MAQFLWEKSPEEGRAYWETYVEWDFWSPYAHAVLAEMYARSGNFQRAESELQWTQNSEFYPTTRQTLMDLRRKAAGGTAR